MRLMISCTCREGAAGGSKVREVAKEAVARARRRDGPPLVECETYKFRGHSLTDPDELLDPGDHTEEGSESKTQVLTAKLACLKCGSEMHGFIIRYGYGSKVMVTFALLNLYSENVGR
ncbi:hypothetical protein QQ045_003959 [Rhodiola kirilowii]